MYSSEPNSSLDPQHLDTQLDFFHKLGYSTAQVQAVQQQFGPNMDTDKVLGELVRIGASREAKQGRVTTMSVLVRRGDVPAGGPTQLLSFSVSPPRMREESGEDEDALRPIVIDGSNVAMSHGNKEVFSCLGIQLTVNFFLDRGHTDVTVFVPSWRKEQPRPDVPISDQQILRDLERKKILVFTPSRRVAGKRVVCNDDWFIVKLAYESDGVIVSNDMYRDLQGKEPEWKRFIEERLLMYTIVNNKQVLPFLTYFFPRFLHPKTHRFMPPDDPLGRHGPTLENFLRRFPKTLKKQLCPYGKKCTYGIKCKFHHAEQSKQSYQLVADEIRENVKHPSSALKHSSVYSSPVPGQSLLLVEDLAKKLTLGHDGDSLKKDHNSENVAHVKTSHRSSKRATSRKEKTGQHLSSDLSSVHYSGSQEKLDSGLGSIDSQQMEAPWSDHQYGHAHSIRQQYCASRSAPCNLANGLSSKETRPAFQKYNQQYSLGPVSGYSSGMTAYGPPHYTSYGACPVNKHAYSQPVDFQHSGAPSCQQPRYWSEPLRAPHPVLCRSSQEHLHWDPPNEAQQSPNRSNEREVVRKKLLAIFSAHLVDMAMNRFPQLMDPQMLVAEILMLQSQHRSLR